MVGNLLSLKFAHLVAAFKRSAWVVVGLVLGILYGLGALVVSVVLFLALRAENAEVVSTAQIGLGALVTLVWLIVPLVASGSDPTLDPDILAPFPLRPGQILGGQLLGSLIGIVGALTLLGLAVPVLAWHGVVPALVSIVGTVLGYALLVAMSRLVSAASMALRSKRFVSESIGAVVFLLCLVAGPLVGAGSAALVESGALARISAVLAWTPLGAPWALAGDVAQGHGGRFALHLLVTLVYLTAAVLVWRRVIGYQISHVGQGKGEASSRTRPGLGLLGRFPATPVGAVAARTAIYLVKDPRFSLNLLAIPGIFVVFYLGTTITGESNMTMAAPFAAWLSAWVTCYAVSYDNSAFSLHVSAPLTGRQDRIGRAAGFGIVFLPLVVASSVLSMVLSHSTDAIPVNLGFSLNLLLAGLGVGAVLSVRMAYPAPPPGASPWRQQRNGAGFANAFAQMGMSLLVFACVIPSVVLTIVWSATEAALWAWATLVVGTGVGALILWIGLILGGKWYDRRSPELLTSVSRFT